MAEKRMFTMSICDSDAFLDMPLSSQCLYFHLNLRADDDGFIGNPKRIIKLINASEDDLKLLLTKRFVLVFESGVMVIKHWRMHNTIKSDRYKTTPYQDELNELILKKNKSYKLASELDENEPLEQLETNWNQNVSVGLGLDLGLDKGLGLDIEKDIAQPESKSKKHKYGSFKNVLLTDDEITRLKNDFKSINIEDLIEWFSAYIEEKGYKSKSHNLAIRRWVIDAYQKRGNQKPMTVQDRINNL